MKNLEAKFITILITLIMFIINAVIQLIIRFLLSGVVIVDLNFLIILRVPPFAFVVLNFNLLSLMHVKTFNCNLVIIYLIIIYMVI